MLVEADLSAAFWQALDELVASHELVVDRPKGSQHPCYGSGEPYPLDYGYLQGTRSGDGEGVDAWVGSRDNRQVTGVLSTVDQAKGDVEIKLLVACGPQEAAAALAMHNHGLQRGLLIVRRGGSQAMYCAARYGAGSDSLI